MGMNIMPDWNHLLPFFTATMVFAFLPGPALLYTAAQTLAHGRRGGFMAALGLHIGGLVHVVAAAAGANEGTACCRARMNGAAGEPHAKKLFTAKGRCG